MGDLFEGGLFGGDFSDPLDASGSAASRRAEESQAEQNALERELKEKFAAEAREDAFKLFPMADVNRNMGFQSALDMMGETTPQQFNTFQQGNVGAQSALLAGQQQQQNAILGLPASMAGFQPQAIQYDTGFAENVQLPEFQTYAGPDALSTESIDTTLRDLHSQFDAGAERGYNDDRGYFSNLNSQIIELNRQRDLLGTDTAAPTGLYYQTPTGGRALVERPITNPLAGI